MRRALLLATLAACGGSSEPAPPPTAAPAEGRLAGGAMLGGAAQARLDGDGHAAAPATTPTRGKASGRPIEIVLRSTPSGAEVSIDGQSHGPTPAYWRGDSGELHEFTFVLKGHAVARYRFVPITSGLVHARLDPVAQEVEAGHPASVMAPHAAPPTVVTPDAAMPGLPAQIDAGPPSRGPDGTGAPQPPVPPAPTMAPATPGFGPQP